MLFKVTLLCVLLTSSLAFPQSRSSEEDSGEYGSFSSEESNEYVKPLKPKKEVKKPVTTPAPPAETTQAVVVVEQSSEAVVVEKATQAAVVVEQTSQANVQIVEDSVKVEENYEKTLTIHDKTKSDDVESKSDVLTTPASAPLDTTLQNVPDLAAFGNVQPDPTQVNVQTDLASAQPDPTQAVVQPDQSTPLNAQDLMAPQSVVDQIFNTPALLPTDAAGVDVRNPASTNAPAVL